MLSSTCNNVPDTWSQSKKRWGCSCPTASAAVTRAGRRDKQQQTLKLRKDTTSQAPNTSLKACCEVLNPGGHSTIQDCEEAGESHRVGLALLTKRALQGSGTAWEVRMSIRRSSLVPRWPLQSCRKWKHRNTHSSLSRDCSEQRQTAAGITRRTKPKQSCQARCLPDKRTGTTEGQRVRSLSMLPEKH